MEEETIRHDWTLKEVEEIYQRPLFLLISQAHQMTGKYHPLGEVQICYLISFKTGGCPEDCKYCPQSARYATEVKPEPLLTVEEMLEKAESALAQGATRICIGAAWRGVRLGEAFDRILAVISQLRSRGVEVCCSLGLLSEEDAHKLKKAGLFAYNHNLDTSRQYYPKIITTRRFEERLQTLEHVESAGLSLCCGGILGLGESHADRISLLWTLATRDTHPESVPMNLLQPAPGTPLEKQPRLEIWQMLRMIATARILMPKALIRLSAGRIDRSLEEQMLCFFAGANSIFAGGKLLTLPTKSFSEDDFMFELFGIKARASSLAS